MAQSDSDEDFENVLKSHEMILHALIEHGDDNEGMQQVPRS